MIALWLEVPEADRELVMAELWEAATAGVTEEASGLRAFFTSETDLTPLLERLARYGPEVEPVAEIDWERETQEAWQSFAVGERFWLAPPWRDDPAPGARMVLRIHPGMACGTGAAPATQLCLEAMERWVTPGLPVLDMGTGTGILAEAARLLGAGPVTACDIDLEAAAIARTNLLPSIGVFAGSLRSVRDQSAATVVANLNAATLRALASDLVRVASRGGTIIVAGFKQNESEQVAAAIGRSTRDRLASGEWACMVF